MNGRETSRMSVALGRIKSGPKPSVGSTRRGLTQAIDSNDWRAAVQSIDTPRPRPKAEIVADILEHTIMDGECIRWTGAHNQGGYGRVRVSSRNYVTAHRAVYELTNGEVQPGMQLDHVCRTRDCVNPKHLEVVTPRENVQRSHRNGVAVRERTHCAKGHELTPDNLYEGRGKRECRTCKDYEVVCESCGRVMKMANLARHRRSHLPGGRNALALAPIGSADA